MAKTEEQATAANQTDKQAEQLKAEKQAKMKALQAAMTKIEKDFGKGSIMRMGDEKVENVEVIPTGSIGLDLALGVGGYPRGRIIEIYGPESSGKTTLAITAIAEAQKRGGIAAFIDAEHAFDRFYAEKLGVDVLTTRQRRTGLADCRPAHLFIRGRHSRGRLRGGAHAEKGD